MNHRAARVVPIGRSVSCKGTLLALALVSTLGAPERAAGQSGEWRAYAADAASTKYSSLDQINASNAQNLRVVWRQSTVPD